MMTSGSSLPGCQHARTQIARCDKQESAGDSVAGKRRDQLRFAEGPMGRRAVVARHADPNSSCRDSATARSAATLAANSVSRSAAELQQPSLAEGQVTGTLCATYHEPNEWP